MEYVLLKNVTQESHRWHVRVRVTRFSEYIDDTKPGKVPCLDLVLLDEQVYSPLYCDCVFIQYTTVCMHFLRCQKNNQATTMEPQVQKDVFIFSVQLSREDHVYYIKYFEVANAKTSHQAVNCPTNG